MNKLFWIPLIFLTACSATKAPKLILQPEPLPSASDDSSLRYPEVIRVYHIGRYTDPDDGLVMHGEHTLYRVEDNARWNLHSDGSEILAPAPSRRDTAFSPVPVNDAILAEVNAQRLATAKIILEARKLAAALAQFQTQLALSKTNLQETAVLRASITEIKLRLDALEAAQKSSPPSTSIPTNTTPNSFNPDNSPLSLEPSP